MKCRQFLLPVVCIGSASAAYSDNANEAITLLQNRFYNVDTGLWKTDKGDMWWQCGGILEGIARFAQVDEDFKPTAIDIISNTYAKSPNQRGATNWHNDFYDDMGWWALGWIASYDLTGEQKYLDVAKDLFEDMTGGWTTPCNGGIWWNKAKEGIASISNELFLSTAAHLANRVSGDEKDNYVNWAQMEWDWFFASGVINENNLINDGIDATACKNNGATTYTYNQGVVLGGLSELAKAKSDGGYIDHANTLASGTLTHLTRDGGILTEPVNDPVGGGLDEQGAEFKGAFIRGLASLNGNEPQQQYTDFFKTNADSLWEKARTSDGIIKDRWQGGSDNWNTASHAAGIDVLVAAAAATE